MPDEVRLDWSSAEMHDGKLVVALAGERPKGWADAFDRTAHLLNQGSWENVKLKKGEVRIRPVAPGEEERVRHFLESVVLEANSAIAPDDKDAEDHGEAEHPAETDDPETSEDAQMTERLRSFAATEDEPPA